MTLTPLLRKHKNQFATLFQPPLAPENTLMMDFSVNNPEMKVLDFTNIQQLNAFVFNEIETAGKVYGYGGYMEDREIYRRSPLFAVSPDEARSIHLGIDVWTQARQQVYCPLNAKVHSFANNDNYGDYGPTIILEHELEGTIFFTLYGHLELESLEGLFVGKPFKKGEEICRVGNFPVNGDWPPHLHFQVIADMKNKIGDYPGVCSKAEKELYKELCPDPVIFFDL